MNKYLFSALALALTFAACSDDDNDPKVIIEPPTSVSAVVLNTGNWGGNDASIMRLDLGTYTMTADLYAAANGEGLGDLGQDIISYGTKYYVTVSSSSKVVVLNKDMTIAKTINVTDDEGVPASPRYLAAANGKVYFTAYDGCLSRIDTTTLNITGKVAIGSYPEGLSYARGKLYANISGEGTIQGSGHTVAVVDEASFTKTKDIEVVLNPYSQSVVANDGNVYIVSNGNYAGASWLTPDQYVYGTVQCINTLTDEATAVCSGTYIDTYANKLFVLYSEYYMPELTKAFIYDIESGTETTLTDLSQFGGLNGVSVDPTKGDVYILEADYGSFANICGPLNAEGVPAHKVPAGFYACKLIYE